MFGKWKQRKDEVMFQTCPNCGNRKWNFEVNTRTGLYHCWVCNFGGKGGGKFISHLGLTNILQEEAISTDDYEVGEISDGSEEANQALRYLTRRGLTEEEINKYVLGYGKQGKYAGYVLLVLYNGDGEPAYMVGRTYKGRVPKYLNPEQEKKALVVGYWNDTDNKVAVCEGVFDAIALNRVVGNVMVMTGKVLTENMIKKSLEYEKLILWPDNDVPFSQRKKMLEDAEKQHNNVWLVHCGNKKDPGEMAPYEIAEILVEDKEKLKMESLMGGRT